PFTDFLTGADRAPGIDTTFQRSVVLSSLTAKAVKTWVPSGRSGSSNVTGASNTGSKPLRTNSLPSLRLMNTEIGPGLSGFGSAGLSSGPVVSRGVPSAYAMASSAGVRGLETSNTVLDACPLRLAALSCANSSALEAPPTVSGELACASPFGSAGSRLIVNKRSLEIATGVT